MVWTMRSKLREMDEENRGLDVGIVGIGKMGRGLVGQMQNIRGMSPRLLINRKPEKALDAYRMIGIEREDLVYSNSIDRIQLALERGKYVVTEYSDLLGKIDGIDAMVDATGNPDTGAQIAQDSLDSGKHMVMLNVEADSVVGPILYKMAQDRDLVYTGTAGDEPGAVMELYNFAKDLGFEVLALGKGKNNPVDLYIRPEDLEEEARAKGLNPRMLAGFIDGTNTMIEMTSMANATGFLPDISGGHGVRSNLDQMTQVFSLKEEGGVLNRYGIVDYVLGIAPGVFLIFTTDSEELRDQLAYVSMGEGPNYILYRPFHLTSMETPVSIFEACVNGRASIAPVKGQVAEAVARAKRDLKAGDYLDGIGGSSFYGSIEEGREAREKGFLPVGLIDGRTRLRRDLKKDQYISYDMVELDKDRQVCRLRKEQDSWLKNK